MAPDGTVLTAPPPAAIATPAGDGSATCADNLSIAFLGPLTGDNREIGGPIRDGAALAVREFAEANPGCHLSLKEFDSRGSQNVVADRAADIVADPSVVALVGPSFSLEVKRTGSTFAAADLLMASPSATDPQLSKNGWTNFFRGLPTDVDGSTAAGHFLADDLQATKVCVVHLDVAETAAQASLVTHALGAAAVADCSGVAQGDFTSTVQAVRSAGADAVYFSANVPASSELVTALRDGGVDAEFMFSDFSYPPHFLQAGGVDVEGSLLACTCQRPPTEFSDRFEKAMGRVPGQFSLPAYELTTTMIDGIRSGKAVDRPTMVEYFRTYDGYGFHQRYAWAPDGELVSPGVTVSRVVLK